MDPILIGAVGATLLVTMIMIGVPIGFAMASVGMAGLAMLAGPIQMLSQVSLVTWESSTDFVLVALPLFILMGQLVFHMGIAADLYQSIRMWLGRLPAGWRSPPLSPRPGSVP